MPICSYKQIQLVLTHRSQIFYNLAIASWKSISSLNHSAFCLYWTNAIKQSEAHGLSRSSGPPDSGEKVMRLFLFTQLSSV